MPKYLFMLALLSVVGFEVNAQKIIFDLNGRVNFTQPDEYAKRDVVQGHSSMRLNDSTEIRSYRELIFYRTNEYLPEIVYDLNGLMTFRLSNRFSLRTGIGLNFWSHSIVTSHDVELGDVISVDTVPSNMIVVISLCDCYENSFADIKDNIDPNILHEMIYLSTPAEVGYDLIPGKLSVKAGLYFQTPLYSVAKREYVELERTTIGDTTKCKYVKKVEKNNPASGVSNFQWGVSAWISYELHPKVQIEIGARQHMNDMYTKEEYQPYNNDNNSFKPLTFSAGLTYKLTKVIPKN